MTTHQQTTTDQFTSTPTAYVVEVGDATVGIVVRDGDQGFTFYAAVAEFYPLDQQRFASAAAAQKAAQALARDRLGSLRSTAARRRAA